MCNCIQFVFFMRSDVLFPSNGDGNGLIHKERGDVNPSVQNTISLKKYHCLLMHFYVRSRPPFLVHVIRNLRPLIQRSNNIMIVNLNSENSIRTIWPHIKSRGRGYCSGGSRKSLRRPTRANRGAPPPPLRISVSAGEWFSFHDQA